MVSTQLDRFLGLGGFVDGQDDLDGFAGFFSIDPEIFAGIQGVEKGLEVPRVILVGDGRRVGDTASAFDLAELLQDFGVLGFFVRELPDRDAVFHVDDRAFRAGDLEPPELARKSFPARRQCSAARPQPYPRFRSAGDPACS